VGDTLRHMKSLRKYGKLIALKANLYRPARALHRRMCDAPFRKQLERIRRFYGGIIRSGDLVFDVGANVGTYSEIFASLGAQVVAVEPLPENVAALHNCSYRKRIRVVEAAVGSEIGTGKIRRASSRTMASMSRQFIEAAQMNPRIQEHQVVWKDEIEVDVTTLDALARDYGSPDFIKVDVEGFEESVLDGLSEQPGYLSFEFTPGLLQAAKRCLAKSIISPDSECNYIVGDPEQFVLDCWSDKDSLMRHLIASPPDLYGDIFVRRTGPHI